MSEPETKAEIYALIVCMFKQPDEMLRSMMAQNLTGLLKLGMHAPSAADRELHLAAARDAIKRDESNGFLSGAAVPSAPTVTEGWIAVTERMPEPGTECIVWSPGNAQHGPFAYLDTWDEQHEAPVSFSTITVPIGLGWDSSDFDSITHWMPLPTPPRAAATRSPE